MNPPTLGFLADESCDFRVVRALRQDGHDVAALCETTSRSIDREVIEQAYREERILLTEDKDFGWLVFVDRRDCPGVILLRYPGNQRQAMARTVAEFIRQNATRIQGCFVVMQPGQIRISSGFPQG